MNRRKQPKKAPGRSGIVFLFDVDNTLLDNDRVIEDLQEFLRTEVGDQRCGRYWKIFERLRSQRGFADYLGALQRYRDAYPHDMRILEVSRYLIDYPFANRLFPNSLDVLQSFQQQGQVALLTDGDVVFQPHKLQRAGLYDTVKGQVLIYVHKNEELADVAAHYPAKHYVVVDDKLHILAAIKKIWRSRVTTVFVRQGHYAVDRKILSANPPADVAIDRIGDLLDPDIGRLFGR
jgi:FMN phosphatase YigB (HAD superfamily)